LIDRVESPSVIVVGKQPGLFEAALSIFCQGGMWLTLFGASLPWWPPNFFMFALLFNSLFVLSWGGAISAVRHGEGRAKAWGTIALGLAIVETVYLYSTPACFV
jgi:hypothetical protein